MSILDVAAATPERKASGPVQYRPLRDPVTDPADGMRLQLVARQSDDEPFIVGCKSLDSTPVERVNARNVARHGIDARIKSIGEALAAKPAPDAATKKALTDERATLDERRKALPRVDVFAVRRPAVALKLYAQMDEAAAAS